MSRDPVPLVKNVSLIGELGHGWRGRFVPERGDT
jgi:hypothetical protein